MHDRAYAHLAASADGRPWKDRDSGGEEHLLLDRGPVHVGVRAHEHVLAEPGRVAAATAHKRVLHDYRAGADLDAPPSAVSTAPNRIRASSPAQLSPQSTALGAT